MSNYFINQPKKLTKNLLWATVSLISIALIFSAFNGSGVNASKPEQIGLGELVSRVNDHKVKAIIVSGN
ncbi:MAG: hypothetical protein AAB316_17740, partial [Bacteroidota bacterium]